MTRERVVPDAVSNMLLILVAGMFLVPLVIGLVAQFVAGARGIELAVPPAATILTVVVVLIQNFTLLALTFWHVTGRHGLGLPFRALGLTMAGWQKEFAIGLRWGAALVVVNIVADRLGRLVFSLILSEERVREQAQREEGVLLDLITAEQPAVLLFLLLVTAVVVAPIVEEIFFRGYAYSVLRHRFGRRALWLSALVFAGVHFYIIHFVPIFAAGVVLAYLYERRGTLIAPMVAHATVNSVIAGVLLFYRANPVI